MERWYDDNDVKVQQCDEAMAMVRLRTNNDMIDHRFIDIAPSRHCYLTTALSLSYHRIIMLSLHRAIAVLRHRSVAPSHHHHRAIILSLNRHRAIAASSLQYRFIALSTQTSMVR